MANNEVPDDGAGIGDVLPSMPQSDPNTQPGGLESPDPGEPGECGCWGSSSGAVGNPENDYFYDFGYYTVDPIIEQTYNSSQRPEDYDWPEEPIYTCSNGVGNGANWSITIYHERRKLYTNETFSGWYVKSHHEFTHWYCCGEKVRRPSENFSGCSWAGYTLQFVSDNSYTNESVNGPLSWCTAKWSNNYNGYWNQVGLPELYIYQSSDRSNSTNIRRANGTPTSSWNIVEIYEEYVYKCMPCSDEDIPFPPMDNINYSYSDSWSEVDEISNDNNNYCTISGGTLETAFIDCLTYYRCKVPVEDCTDIPFPPKENGEECKFSYDDCEPYVYSEPWCCDYFACGGGAAGASERYDCVGEMLDFGSYWIDGKRVSYYTSDGEIETAYINCLDMCRCKSRKNWRYYPPKDPLGYPPNNPQKHWIENPPPEDPNISPIIPFKPTPVPPIICPPCHPCPPEGPILPDGCCDTTSDNDLYSWCNCDIVEPVPDACGCFEKPINRQTSHCCDYVPKKYNRWTVNFNYRNDYDNMLRKY